MPRQTGVSVENNFIKGLITEISPLNFPENAATETYNCVFGQTGTVSRRLGMAFESGFVGHGVVTVNNAHATFLWKNVAEEGDKQFVVVQNGNTLHFYEPGSDSALSAGKHANTIDLTTFLPAGGVASASQVLECQFAGANGRLIVTHPKLDHLYVEYNSGSNTISATEYVLRVRDFEGDTADTLFTPTTISTRPSTTLAGMNANHRYNLENQGWTTTTLTAWDTARADMPSNCDVAWYYKNDSTDAYDFARVDSFTIGNSRAPNGHFIYDLYNTNRSSNVSGATDASIPLDRLSTCAFFAGRVWYGGLKVQNYNSKIYFSKILESKADFGLCYQTEDPAAELLSDLLPSDGGFIDLLEAGNVLKMIPILNTLFVFCTNGVWAISGSQGAGFAANDYSVNKISDISNSTHTSFVVAEDTVYWWSQTGIYTIRKDQQTNALAVVSLTDNSILSFFYQIPLEARELARGIYDSLNKRIQWIYKSTTSQSFTDKYRFDRVLNMSTLTGAFYPWSLGTSIKVLGIVSVTGAGGAEVQNSVTSASGANVVQSGGGANNVVVFQSLNSAIDTVTKFFVSDAAVSEGVTFAEEWSDSYMDWGVEDYESYFVTGYRLRGEAMRKYQNNYLRLYTDNTLPSKFRFRGIWDFAIDGTRGRFTEIAGLDQSIIISDDTSYAVKSKRIKVRGHGLCLQFMVTSQTGQPFDLIGWSSFDSVNQKP